MGPQNGDIGLSARSVRRRLADHGTTYSELVTQVRLSIVKELLEEPDSKIIDAAAAVGYSDPSHFSRAFRRVGGVTPRQYRDAVLSGERA
jgi:AraC-like DNA-binding protein